MLETLLDPSLPVTSFAQAFHIEPYLVTAGFQARFDAQRIARVFVAAVAKEDFPLRAGHVFRRLDGHFPKLASTIEGRQ